MKFGVLKLTNKARKTLSAIFVVISVILIIISFVVLCQCIYLNLIIAPNLYSEKSVIRLTFTIIAMLAMQLKIYYLGGILICRKCHKEAFKKNSKNMLRIWSFIGYSTLTNIVIIGSMASGVSNHIIRSMHHSMIRGMKRYLKDISWKEIIDDLQYNLQCCGSHHYTDWHKVSWMSTWHFINSSDIIEQTCLTSCQHVFVPAVPWSCCRLDYPNPCFHDPIQQYQYSSNWKNLTEESVNNVGCIQILRQPIEYTFLIFIFLSFVILFLQIILSIISRYLYTSYKNAIILGDPFGVAPGWIFSTETPSEIMSDDVIFDCEGCDYNEISSVTEISNEEELSQRSLTETEEY